MSKKRKYIPNWMGLLIGFSPFLFFFFICLSVVVYNNVGSIYKVYKKDIPNVSFCQYLDVEAPNYYKYYYVDIYQCRAHDRKEYGSININAYSSKKNDFLLWKSRKGIANTRKHNHSMVVNEMVHISELDNGILLTFYQYNLANSLTSEIKQNITEFEFTYNDIYHTGDISIISEDPLHNTFEYHRSEITTLLLQLFP